MQRKRQRLCALVMCLAMLPFAALAEESGGVFEDMGRTYVAALALFDTAEAGEYARAKALFDELDDYRDASKYAAYCGALMALEEGDAEGAALTFQTLRSLDFLDATALYFYAQARRAEQEGELTTAIQLLEGIDVLDSLTRLVELKITFAQAEGAQRQPLPINAREDGLAVVVTDWTDGLDVPAGQRKRSEFPLYELLLIDTFDYDSQGMPWDQTTLEMDSPYAVEALTDETPVFSDAESIYHMSEEEESSFRAGIPLETARVKPAYGTVTGQTINVRQTAGGNRGSANVVVNKGDSVELLGVVPDDNGNLWQKIRYTSGDEGEAAEGYIPEAKVVDLSELPDQPVEAETDEEIKIDWSSGAPAFALSLAPGNSYEEEDLEKARENLEEQRSYKHSEVYSLYLDVLIAIERGDYDGALAALPDMRKGVAAIAEAALKAGAYPYPIRLPDEVSLRNYILGRQAEAEGDDQRAAEHYWANDTRDSVARLASLIELEPLDVALRYKVNDQFGFDMAALLNWLMEIVCKQPACADRPIHITWQCGHCAYAHTELCGEPPCSVCDGYLCDSFTHEKICNVCGAYDCTDARGGAENHGAGKCVKRKQAESAPEEGDEQYTGWAPPGWFDLKAPCNCGGGPHNCLCNPCRGGC